MILITNYNYLEHFFIAYLSVGSCMAGVVFKKAALAKNNLEISTKIPILDKIVSKVEYVSDFQHNIAKRSVSSNLVTDELIKVESKNKSIDKDRKNLQTELVSNTSTDKLPFTSTVMFEFSDDNGTRNFSKSSEKDAADTKVPMKKSKNSSFEELNRQKETNEIVQMKNNVGQIGVFKEPEKDIDLTSNNITDIFSALDTFFNEDFNITKNSSSVKKKSSLNNEGTRNKTTEQPQVSKNMDNPILNGSFETAHDENFQPEDKGINSTKENGNSTESILSMVSSEVMKNAAMAMEIFNFSDFSLTDHIIEENEVHVFLDSHSDESDTSTQIQEITNNASSTNISTEFREPAEDFDISHTNGSENETLEQLLTQTNPEASPNLTEELSQVNENLLIEIFETNGTVSLNEPASNESLTNQTSIVESVKHETQVRSCPPPGICLFWFVARDTCTSNEQCDGSKICCRVRCSKVCVEVLKN